MTVRSVVILGVLTLVLTGCSGYGGETVGQGIEGGFVQTDGEHCGVTLPEGWTWYPARWAARSPNGTEMAFEESVYGRPMNPDWQEARDQTVADVQVRVPSAAVTVEEDRVRIDYGPDAGLAILQRFDRIGCKLTFSRAEGAREQEIDQWEAIIASLERTSPTPGYTPTP